MTKQNELSRVEIAEKIKVSIESIKAGIKPEEVPEYMELEWNDKRYVLKRVKGGG